MAKLRWVLAAALSLGVAVGVTACGGGEAQDEDEPKGTWKVDVISASFPGKQTLAQTSKLRIKVKNLESRVLPNLAVTVDGFDQRSENPDLSDPSRPRWIVEEPPDDSATAFTNTWSIGELPAGETRTLEWKVTAVRAGTYTLRYRVGSGVHGKAKASLLDGEPASGSFVIRVSEKPRPPRID